MTVETSDQGRLVPVRAYAPAEPRTTHNLLESLCQLAEENLAVNRHVLACLSAMNDAAATAANAGSDSVSSIAIEDMAKGDPKITSKMYPTSPLTREDIDRALANHAYAHRRAAELAMSGWAESVEALKP